jgi:hypothetical protein
MKTVFASLAAAIAAGGFTQASAHAMTLPVERHVASAVSQTTFSKAHSKVHRNAKHARALRKHRAAHAEKQLKKKH